MESLTANIKGNLYSFYWLYVMSLCGSLIDDVSCSRYEVCHTLPFLKAKDERQASLIMKNFISSTTSTSYWNALKTFKLFFYCNMIISTGICTCPLHALKHSTIVISQHIICDTTSGLATIKTSSKYTEKHTRYRILQNFLLSSSTERTQRILLEKGHIVKLSKHKGKH